MQQISEEKWCNKYQKRSDTTNIRIKVCNKYQKIGDAMNIRKEVMQLISQSRDLQGTGWHKALQHGSAAMRNRVLEGGTKRKREDERGRERKREEERGR